MAGAATLARCCLSSMLVYALDFLTLSTMGSDEPGRVSAHAHRNSTEGACSSPRLARLHDRRRADETAFASPLHSGTAVEGRCSSCFRTLLERAPHGRPPGAVSRGGRICVRSAGTLERRGLHGDCEVVIDGPEPAIRGCARQNAFGYNDASAKHFSARAIYIILSARTTVRTTACDQQRRTGVGLDGSSRR